MLSRSLLIATTNLGKLKEFNDLLTRFNKVNSQSLKIYSLNDFPHLADVEETENSFLGNALLKAKYYYKQTNIPTLADDSGLVIPSLNGEPGVYSARYAGKNVNFTDNIALVLKKMEHIKNREAYFLSCLIFLTQENLYTVSEAKCYGEITTHPIGNNGFGYDPIFKVPDFNKTMAEITLQEKQSLSHRSLAFKQLMPTILSYTSL